MYFQVRTNLREHCTLASSVTDWWDISNIVFYIMGIVRKRHHLDTIVHDTHPCLYSVAVDLLLTHHYWHFTGASLLACTYSSLQVLLFHYYLHVTCSSLLACYLFIITCMLLAHHYLRVTCTFFFLIKCVLLTHHYLRVTYSLLA